MNLTPIGTIHSPHQQSAGTPIQAALATGVRATVEVFSQYAAGLRDLEGFERIWLVYWFDRAKPPQLVVTPYLDTTPRGLFATRAPSRPNPIGLSPVRLLGIKGNILEIEGADMLDGTPLLDIKPYLPEFDAFQVTRIGWCAQARHRTTTADGRFDAAGAKPRP